LSLGQYCLFVLTLLSRSPVPIEGEISHQS
jgi:hypothetical protein